MQDHDTDVVCYFITGSDTRTGATTLWDSWDASLQLWRSLGLTVCGPLQLLQLAVIFAGHCEKLTAVSPDLLAKFNGRRKEEQGREWVKHG